MATRLVTAEIDLDTLKLNIALLRRIAAPARLCAVVKANAYGHGAVQVGAAALAGGATWLAVALVEEGVELREAGIDAPVLVLSEPSVAEVEDAVAVGLSITVYSPEAVAAANAAALLLERRAHVHVKVDTGMHRAGADPTEVRRVSQLIRGAPGLVFEGFFTQLAMADDPNDAFNLLQFNCFRAVHAELLSARIQPEIVHVANSAAALYLPWSRLDLVRCGIACYGYPPGVSTTAVLEAQLEPGEAFRPVLSLKARVAFVRYVRAGERPSYGRLQELTRDGFVATVAVGYADGVPRLLGERGGAVLIKGRRCPIAGAVTMDQIVVYCGPEGDVSVGDEVVLIGRQGGAEITAAEWAELTGTIPNEILSRIGTRVPRRFVGATAGLAGH